MTTWKVLVITKFRGGKIEDELEMSLADRCPLGGVQVKQTEVGMRKICEDIHVRVPWLMFKSQALGGKRPQLESTNFHSVSVITMADLKLPVRCHCVELGSPGHVWLLQARISQLQCPKGYIPLIKGFPTNITGDDHTCIMPVFYNYSKDE